MRAALAAHHFGAAHEETAAFLFSDVFGLHGCIKTRPAGAGIEFGVGTEKIRTTADALVNALVLAVVVAACERTLGAFLTRDLVLFRRQDFFPFRVVLVYLAFHDQPSCLNVSPHANQVHVSGIDLGGFLGVGGGR